MRDFIFVNATRYLSTKAAFRATAFNITPAWFRKSAFGFGWRFRPAANAAERKVLEHIADGKPPQETADHLGISVNTVKTHLQKIFAKTNTGRQADLIHLVTRSTAPLKAKQQPTD